MLDYAFFLNGLEDVYEVLMDGHLYVCYGKCDTVRPSNNNVHI